MMGRVRLLVVSPSLARGGAQRFASTLLNRLDRNRFAPELALLRSRRDFPLADDVLVHELGYRGLATGPLSVARLARLLTARKPDLVLSTLASSSIITGGALSLCSKPPLWLARIGDSPHRGDDRLRKFLLRRVSTRASLFIPNSEAVRRETEDVYPFTRGKIRVLPNPADFKEIDSLLDGDAAPELATDLPVVLSVGRLDPQKRPDLMLEVFARVRKEISCKLWVVGDGELLPSLQNATKVLGISEDVTFLGFVPRPFALMQKASVLLMPSDHEGLPNAAIEAQGLGLPVVTTKTGAEEAVVHGETGFAVPIGDVPSLTLHVTEILKDPVLRHRLSATARQVARARFDVASVIPLWEKTLLEAAAR